MGNGQVFYNLVFFLVSAIASIECLHYAKQTLTEYGHFGTGREVVCGILNGIIVTLFLSVEGMWTTALLLFGCPVLLILEIICFTKDKVYSYGCLYVKLAMNFMAIYWLVTSLLYLFDDSVRIGKFNFVVSIFFSGMWSLILSLYKRYPMEELKTMMHDKDKGRLFFTYVLICDGVLGISTLLLFPLLSQPLLSGNVRIIVMVELFLKTLVIFVFGYILLFLRSRDLRYKKEHLEDKINLENERRFRNTVQRKGIMNLMLNLADLSVKDGGDHILNDDIKGKSFEEIVEYLAEIMVHEDDREEFIYSNSLKIIQERLESNPYYSHTIKIAPHELQRQFRISEKASEVYRSINKPFVWIKIDYIYTRDSSTGDIYFFLVAFDVDEEMTLREELHLSATTDALTGLLNRSVMQYSIEKELQKKCVGNCLILLDVDNFKQINDKLGHPVGDKVLLKFSEALRQMFRSGDLIGRLGGDEFSVFMPGLSDRKVIEERVKELNRRCRLSYETKDGLKVGTSASVGIVISSGNDDYESLYKKADEALYQSKQRGKDSYYFYN